MTEQEIRKNITDAVHRLVDEKLAARSWGNISARLSGSEFIITPSGKAYSGMKESDLVKVKIADLSWEGEFKPSSEKGVHAAVYKNRADAAFVIHTHQDYASAVCAAGEDVVLPGGMLLPCAVYAAPGTDELVERLSEKLKEYPSAKAFLLSNHGTVFFGKDSDEVFELALSVENKCKELFERTAGNGEEDDSLPDESCFLDDYAQMMPPMEGEDEEAIRMVRHKNHLAALFAKNRPPMDPEHCRKEHEDYINSYSKLWYDKSVMSKVIEVDATLKNAPVMQGQMDEFLESIDCPMKVNMQLDIAFDEIYSNIVFYAYNNQGGNCTLIMDEIEKDGKKGVSITFIDAGPKYDPLAKEDPDVTLSAEKRAIGGLGIFLVKKQMDDMVYEYKDGRNHLTLVKYF